jgi:hypothetical protein
MSAGTNGRPLCYRSLNEDGSWKDLTKQKNSSADISPTAGQMQDYWVLQASKYTDKFPYQNAMNFLMKNEIAWGTIGNASTSEEACFLKQ